MKDIKFWHKVKLNDGSYTNGMIDVEKLEKTYLFDTLDLNNKSVLDIGCWDGYFSFQSEKHGANRVVSFDNPECRWGATAGYDFLHTHFNSKATFVRGNVYDINNIFKFKEFDVVLCYGVLYHLSDPLLALDNMFHCCNDIIAFEGIFSEATDPILELIPLSKFNNDDSNIYIPSISYMKLIAEYNGFSMIKISDTPMWKRYCMLFKRQSDVARKFRRTAFPK